MNFIMNYYNISTSKEKYAPTLEGTQGGCYYKQLIYYVLLHYL